MLPRTKLSATNVWWAVPVDFYPVNGHECCCTFRNTFRVYRIPNRRMRIARLTFRLFPSILISQVVGESFENRPTISRTGIFRSRHSIQRRSSQERARSRSVASGTIVLLCAIRIINFAPIFGKCMKKFDPICAIGRAVSAPTRLDQIWPATGWYTLVNDHLYAIFPSVMPNLPVNMIVNGIGEFTRRKCTPVSGLAVGNVSAIPTISNVI